MRKNKRVWNFDFEYMMAHPKEVEWNEVSYDYVLTEDQMRRAEKYLVWEFIA